MNTFMQMRIFIFYLEEKLTVSIIFNYFDMEEYREKQTLKKGE